MITKLYKEIEEKIEETEIYIQACKRDIDNGIDVDENYKILLVLQNQLCSMKILTELYNLNIEKLEKRDGKEKG